MKSKEEIINTAIKEEVAPNDYNLLEIQCFLALKQLLIMYHNNQIKTENATLMKQKILSKYENDSKQYEFENSIYKEHIQNIRDTENLRTKLRHKLKHNDGKEVTTESLCETILLCTQIIGTVFKEEY